MLQFGKNKDEAEKRRSSRLQSGDYDLNHDDNCEQTCDEFCSKIFAAGEQFTDTEFHIQSPDQYARLGEQCWEGHFIDDDLTACDINQGGLGSCWFLSALSALAQPNDCCPFKIKEDTIHHVIQSEQNMRAEAKSTGLYRFKFFRLGEWVDVVIDDQLPWGARANPSAANEWWVPLCEKAYAKLHGSYENINGGFPAVALSELTDGITIDIKSSVLRHEETKKGLGDDVFNVLRSFQNRAVICVGNNVNRVESEETCKSTGLMAGHAYTLLRLEKVAVGDNGETEKLVKIRNPHATNEWKGAWADWCVGSVGEGSTNFVSKWDNVSEEEKARIGYADQNDGEFWMTFNDCLNEFEEISICKFPRLGDDEHELTVDEAKARDHRVIGVFEAGVNAPHGDPRMFDKGTGRVNFPQGWHHPDRHVQIELNVGKVSDEDDRLVWIQFLLDSHPNEFRMVMFNIYEVDQEINYLSEDQIKLARDSPAFSEKVQLVKPTLPVGWGNGFAVYMYNGYLYKLKANRKYIITATQAVPSQSTKPCKFMIRTIGRELSLQHLERAVQSDPAPAEIPTLIEIPFVIEMTLPTTWFGVNISWTETDWDGDGIVDCREVTRTKTMYIDHDGDGIADEQHIVEQETTYE